VDGNLAIGQHAIADPQAVAAAMQAGATGVRQGLVAFDAQRKVGLDELVGHVGEARPQRVAIGAITGRTPRNTAEADLEQLEPFAVLVVARVHEVRRIREARSIHRVRRALAEQAAHHVEDASQRVGPAGQRGGEVRLQQRALRDAYFDQVVEAVVEQDRRVEEADG